MSRHKISRLVKRFSAPKSDQVQLKNAMQTSVDSSTGMTVKLNAPGRTKIAVTGNRYDPAPAVTRAIKLSDLPGGNWTRS